MTRQIVIGSCLLVISYLSFGQEISNELSREIQRRIRLEINPSISIGLLLPNGETKFYNYGQYSKRNGETADSLTLYEIGSITKTFTATLINRYLKDALGTSLSNVFSNVDNPNLERITLSDLRNHAAGVPRLSKQFSPEDWSDPFNGYSNDLLKIELQSLTPDTSETWSYSNFGYGILGRALEVTTNQTFDDLMGKLLREAGMTNTFLKISSNQSQKLAEPTNVGTANSHWNFTGPSRYAGGLVSCTRDLLYYLKYQKETNPLFGSDSLESLIQTGVPNLGEDQLFYRDGWFVLRPESNTSVLLHNGGTGGFISFIGYNKNTDVGVVVLSNSVSIVDDIGLKIVYPAFELNQPERTIAYELADAIDEGKTEGLTGLYDQLKKAGYPDNIIDIYWLERYFFGKENYSVSNQLSDLMVEALPEDWEVMDIKGQNLEGLARYQEAKEAYEKALKLNPDNKLLREKIKRCANNM